MYFLQKYNKYIYIVLLLACLLPWISPPVALFLGLAFALSCGQAFPVFNKKASKYLLQISVVGLGFNMNLHQALQSGKEGLIFTVVSVMSVMILGYLVGKKLRINQNISYLISSGTAICGGSAIAAIAPLVKAKENEMSISLGTVFILNAIALFFFPILGHLLRMSQEQFGLWAAIAIHDTSSVVGAGATYGAEALQVATTVKLTRTLWIIPIAFVTSLIFKNKNEKIYIPWFILFFVVAMVINTFLPFPQQINDGIIFTAHKGLTLTLFMIGSSLSLFALKQVGVRPVLLGIILWFFISVISLMVIL